MKFLVTPPVKKQAKVLLDYILTHCLKTFLNFFPSSLFFLLKKFFSFCCHGEAFVKSVYLSLISNFHSNIEMGRAQTWAWRPRLKLELATHNITTKKMAEKEVVVAQVVERCILSGRPGSNPTLDFGFFQFRIAVNLFPLGVRLFLIMCNRTVHTLPSSFLFPIINYHCENYQL